MQRIPPSVHLWEALTAQLHPAPLGHLLRQFVGWVPEYPFQVGLEKRVAIFLGPDYSERRTTLRGWRNGSGIPIG